MVALFAGLAMVAGVLTVTQLASSALEERNGGLGASECETTAPPEETEAPEEGAEGAEEEEGAEEAAEGTEDAEAAGGTDGEATDGEATEGEATEGEATEGEATEGEATEGEAAEDPAADGVTSTDELEAHVEVEADGTEHVHYRRPGWRDRDWGRGRGRGHHHGPRPTTPPAQECEEPTTAPTEEPTGDPTEDPGGDPTSEPTDGPTEEPTADPTEEPTEDPGGSLEPGVVPPGGADGNNNGLEVLGRDCTASNLPLHQGFQDEQASCVNTQMGEASAFENNPSLMIVDFPDAVAVGEEFAISVSTRNLVRDRFLGAGAGGYYLESSFLDENGITRGHFHLGCLRIADPTVAPDPQTLASPQFFVAVEDGGGGSEPSLVDVVVTGGLPESGEYRCAAWAGDATHRIPMMTFARQQTAVDVVRITVE